MSPAINHWASAYIGAEWTRDQTCWHFAARVWREHFGIIVALVSVDGADARATRRLLAAEPERAAWAGVAVPREGDAVLMAKGLRPCHVGIWLGLGGVLHSIEGAGAIYTPVGRLAGLGYRIVGYYRRAA